MDGLTKLKFDLNASITDFQMRADTTSTRVGFGTVELAVLVLRAIIFGALIKHKRFLSHTTFLDNLHGKFIQ